MIATAKGITAGCIPLGALIISDKIVKHFYDHVLWLELRHSTRPVFTHLFLLMSQRLKT
jgi:taurine--2-oxoglutarate transaminase